MEGLYSNYTLKRPKLKSLDGNVSPINTQNFIGRSRYHHPPKSPMFDPYASSDGSNSPNSDSPLFRYLRSGSSASVAASDSFRTPVIDDLKYRDMPMIGHQHVSGNSNNNRGSSGLTMKGSSSVSPLSAIENLETPSPRSPTVFKTPIKVEEDVLVMDGILVDLVPSGRVKFSSSSSSDSGGTSSFGNNTCSYKTEKCQLWEDSSTCRFGSKCKFAHGKEELRPSRFANKNKSEAQICKSYNLGSCTYGTKCSFVHHQLSKTVSPRDRIAAATSSATTQIVSSSKLEHKTGNIAFPNTDWSPQDDGIKVTLPSASADKSPSREDVDAHIHSVLYGPSQRKRLPVLVDICPR